MISILRPRSRTEPPAELPRLAPGGEVPVMLRSGRPGTLSDDQLEALEANGFLPPAPLARLSDLSGEEAAQILAALDYLRAAIAQITGESAPTEIENQALALILADENFALAALRWADGGRPTPLRESAAFLRLKTFVMGFWQPPAG
jgi:hypothetical protein